MDYSFPILANERMDYKFPVWAIFGSFLYSEYPSSLGISSGSLWSEYLYLHHDIEHNYIRDTTITIFEPTPLEY